ncbi:hypothetical protein LCGC14_1067540, partial [marine sediment metagenome]
MTGLFTHITAAAPTTSVVRSIAGVLLKVIVNEAAA